jgi:osmotically-inducible protein OsmY
MPIVDPSRPNTARGRGVALVLCAALLAAPLSGCTGIVIGAGAVTAKAAAEERGLKAAAADLGISTSINAKWLDRSETLVRKLDTMVSEGRVLVTGVVPTEDMRDEAIRLAWQAPNVKEVINEIEVRADDDLSEYARDSWISTRLRARLTVDKRIHAINYQIETSGGTVYLLGIAQDAAELARVQNHARDIPYVRRIVSHVILKDDPRRHNRAASR